MSFRRLHIAFEMTAREFLRRRGMLSLIFGVPVLGFLLVYLALPKSPAAIEAIENGVKVRVDLNQVELFSGVSALSYVGLLAGITGLYLLHGALKGDRRLRLTGYRPVELLGARIVLLLMVDGVLTVFLVGLTLIFAFPRQLPEYLLAVFFAAMIYSFYGGLIGMLVRSEMGGIIGISFLANIDIGYLQLPGFSTVLEEWWIKLLPGHFPVQLAIDAAFTARPELLLPSLWSLPHGLIIAGLMLGAYQRATAVRPFLPEERGRQLPRLIGGLAVLGILAFVGLMTYEYYAGKPPAVAAEGRITAPVARILAPTSGQIRNLQLAEGDTVKAGSMVGWIEEYNSSIMRPVNMAALAGTITSLPVREGENVVQGAVLATVHDLKGMEVTLNIEETDVAKVKVGYQVELRFAALNETIVSDIASIGHEPLPPEAGVTEAAKRVRKYPVKVPLPRLDERLRLDMAVSATIFLQ